ncbi:MAG: carboxylesterase/lipase family protein [Streptosporangiaceae bacterium]
MTLVAAAATVVAGLTVAAAGGAAAAQPPACAPGTTVNTADGPVCGVTAGGVTSYLGVPYAAAPVGQLRWAPPRPAPVRTGTFDATAQGSECAQPSFSGPGVSGSEDCLNLNVQIPAGTTAGSKLPVMVEFHGGGFQFFGPDDGSPLVTAGHIIFVGVNYRLGILGFMASKGLGPHAGDYGLQDEQASLRWVRQNIAGFGGNPRNVTIFGASAGGSSVCDAVASPAATGLFQKGISESGEYNASVGPNTAWPPQDCKTQLPTEAQAGQAGAAFAAAVGCGSGTAAQVAACLRNVPVPTLIKQEQVGGGLSLASGTLAPIVNGTTLPMSPGLAFATGRFNHHVSLIIGVARDENYGGGGVLVKSVSQYRQLITQQYGPALAQRILALYPPSRFPGWSNGQPTPATLFIAHRTVVADSDAVCPALRNDARLSRHIPVFAYEVDDADAPTTFFLPAGVASGSYHVDESFLLFDTASAHLDPNQQALSDQLKAEWTGFARTGNPTVDGAPLWIRYTGWNPLVMSLVPAGDSALNPASTLDVQHNCGFWDAVTPVPGH